MDILPSSVAMSSENLAWARDMLRGGDGDDDDESGLFDPAAVRLGDARNGEDLDGMLALRRGGAPPPPSAVAGGAAGAEHGDRFDAVVANLPYMRALKNHPTQARSKNSHRAPIRGPERLLHRLSRERPFRACEASLRSSEDLPPSIDMQNPLVFPMRKMRDVEQMLLQLRPRAGAFAFFAGAPLAPLLQGQGYRVRFEVSISPALSPALSPPGEEEDGDENACVETAKRARGVRGVRHVGFGIWDKILCVG